jgi:hypothetical protein
MKRKDRKLLAEVRRVSHKAPTRRRRVSKLEGGRMTTRKEAAEAKQEAKEATREAKEHADLRAKTKSTEPEIVPLDVGASGIRPEGMAAPTVTELQPNTAVCGDTNDIRMYVVGTGFTKDSVIVFNGFDEPTTLHDATRVSTGVKPSLFVVPAVCPVAVRNPGYAITGALDFTFTEKVAEPEADAEQQPELASRR